MKAIMPWAGWIGGIAGWAAAHQAGSYLAQYDCTRATPAWMAPIGLLAAVVAIAGGLASLRVWRASGSASRSRAGTRHFIAGTGALASGLFLLAILFQTLSSFVIPSCYA